MAGVADCEVWPQRAGETGLLIFRAQITTRRVGSERSSPRPCPPTATPGKACRGKLSNGANANDNAASRQIRDSRDTSWPLANQPRPLLSRGTRPPDELVIHFVKEPVETLRSTTASVFPAPLTLHAKISLPLFLSLGRACARRKNLPKVASIVRSAIPLYLFLTSLAMPNIRGGTLRFVGHFQRSRRIRWVIGIRFFGNRLFLRRLFLNSVGRFERFLK